MNNIFGVKVMEEYIRMCHDGVRQGWHERNGGNLTYRMREEEVAECRPYFKAVPGEWVALGVQADNLKGEYFISTGSGKFLQNVGLEPQNSICIVEINGAGDSYRIVWGLENGGRPTSEFPTHLMNHSVRKPRDLPCAHALCDCFDLCAAPEGGGFYQDALEKRYRVLCGVSRRRGRGALDGAWRP